MSADDIAVGSYTVRRGVVSAFSPQSQPLWLVYRDGEYIGKSFSQPSEDDCRWLERTRGTLHASTRT